MSVEGLQGEVDRLTAEVTAARVTAAHFLAFIEGEYGVKLSAEDKDDHNVSRFLALADIAPWRIGGGE